MGSKATLSIFWTEVITAILVTVQLILPADGSDQVTVVAQATGLPGVHDTISVEPKDWTGSGQEERQRCDKKRDGQKPGELHEHIRLL
jgi:hypothetical protein